MILKYTKVECVDKESRFVLKKTLLGNMPLLNRKHAVTNQIFAYERARLKEKKGLFPNTLYQTHHIFYEKYVGWDYTDLEMARSHAETHGRLFIPFQQKNFKQWTALDWNKAESSFMSLASRGLQIVPYPLPLSATLEEWGEYKETAKEKILPSQEIMPILNIRHNEDYFQDIMSSVIREFKIIGLHLYRLNKSIEVVNLSRLRATTIKLKNNELCGLIVGFNFPRRLTKWDSVNSSFAYSTFGIDIFSPEQLSPAQMRAMLRDEEKVDEYTQVMYDCTQGGYSTNPDQEAWHEIGLIDLLTENVSVAEGLNKYQVVIWCSTRLEQRDLDILNGKILARENVIEYIVNEKSKWNVFWNKYGSEAIG